MLTVSVTLALMPLLDLAVMVVVPKATPVARPELSIVAIAGTEDVHVTDEVTSPVVLLPKVAVAENCCVFCGMMKEPLGLIEIEAMSCDPIKNPEQALTRRTSGSAMPNLQYLNNPDLDIIPLLQPRMP